MQVGRCIPAGGGGGRGYGNATGGNAREAFGSNGAAGFISIIENPKPMLDSLEAIRVKLVEIEHQAERTAAALAKIKL